MRLPKNTSKHGQKTIKLTIQMFEYENPYASSKNRFPSTKVWPG
jgi:hypothetical protein